MPAISRTRTSSLWWHDALAGRRWRRATPFLLVQLLITASIGSPLFAGDALTRSEEGAPAAPSPAGAGLARPDPVTTLSLDLSDTALLGLLPGEEADQPAAASDPLPAADDWTFEAAPFVWALSYDGNVTAAGATASVDLNFSDIFDDLDFAAMLQLRARKDRLVLQANGLYAKLSVDDEAGFRGDIMQVDFGIPIVVPVGADVRVDVKLKLAIVELFAGYEIFSSPLESEARNPFSQRGASVNVIAYGGVRYNHLNIDSKLEVDGFVGPDAMTGTFRFDGSSDWFDPVVGVDVAFMDLGPWSINIRGDIGGFSIGDASKLVWSVGGRVNYQFSPKFRMWAGYFLLDYDYSQGSGRSKFGIDGTFQGPVIGGTITF